jgi:hypothetical protein
LFQVLVNKKVITKPGHAVSSGAVVEINAEAPKYVCRAGFKLEAALEAFTVDVQGLVALDAGLSTGGFTDCLLQRGVQKVMYHAGLCMQLLSLHAATGLIAGSNKFHWRPYVMPTVVPSLPLSKFVAHYN